MTLVQIVTYGLWGVSAVGLLLAAITDIRTRRIPNWTVGLVAIGAIAAALVAGDLAAIGAGLLALLFGLILWSIRWIGGGDAKLFAAAATLAGWSNLANFAVLTVIAGGVLAILMLAMRPTSALAMLQLRAPVQSIQIPYGVAIAFGGLALLWQQSVGQF